MGISLKYSVRFDHSFKSLNSGFYTLDPEVVGALLKTLTGQKRGRTRAASGTPFPKK